MKPIKETNNKQWLPQVWPGNPELDLLCSAKYFTNPFGGKPIPVFVHGKDGRFNYTVSAGANSDFSYSGMCADNCTTLEAATDYIDQLNTQNKLIR